MNHIKQVIKVEVIGTFRAKKNQKLPEGRTFYNRKLCKFKTINVSFPQTAAFTTLHAVFSKMANTQLPIKSL